MNSTRFVPIKHFFAMIALASIGVVLSACSPPADEELSLALNVKEGDIFRMSYEYKEISTTTYLGEPSNELYITDWEFSFQVESIDQDEITLRATVDSLVLSNDNIYEFVKSSDFQSIEGESFAFTVSSDGEVIDSSNSGLLKEQFMEALPLEERVFEKMNDRIGIDMTLEEFKADETYSRGFDFSMQALEPVISGTMEYFLGEMPMSNMLRFMFASASNRSVQQGISWQNDNFVFSNYIATLPITADLTVEEIESSSAVMSLSGESSRLERNPIDEKWAVFFSSMGISPEVSDLNATISGDLEVDLLTGMLQEAEYEISSKMQMHFELSDELIGFMNMNSELSENERRERIEALRTSLAYSEVEIEIRRID